MESNANLPALLRAPGAVGAVLDGCSEAVFVFDGGDRLVFSNAAARRLLARRALDATSRARLLAALEPLGPRVAGLDGRDAPGAAVVYVGSSPAGETLAERERRAIVERLEATGWRLAEAARALGISRTTLWRRLRAYGIDRHRRVAGSG